MEDCGHCGGGGGGDDREDVPAAEVNIRDANVNMRTERRLKAEEKRQANLQRIRDMRSTTGIDPLELFPKEIWMIILMNHDELDPEELGHLWKLHPTFRDLLEATLDRNRDILLPQVVKVPAFQRWMKVIFGRKEGGHEGEGSLFNEQLRLISKKAKKAFDRYMEESIIERIRETEATPVAGFEHAENFRLFKSYERKLLPRLLSAFRDGENPAKRFFPRGLSVSFSGRDMEFDDGDRNIPGRIQELCNQFEHNLNATLEVIGSQIWHFRIFIFELGFRASLFKFSEIFLLFQRWISIIPNLKWLELSIDDSEETIVMKKGTDKKSVARDLLRKYPFPRLSSLERISLHFRSFPGQMEIFAALIAANPHIKILDFTDVDKSKLRLLPARVIKSLHNLSRISVINEIKWNFNWIEPMLNPNWQLKSITLSCLGMKNSKLDSLFRLLEKWPTLEDVVLCQVHELRIGNDDDFGFLELPNLITFSLTLEAPAIEYDSFNVHQLFSLQFLMRCKKLTSLKWLLKGIDDIKLRKQLRKHEIRGKTLDFRGGLRNLYYSTIWDVFPYLDTVTVEVGELKRQSESHQPCTHTYYRAVYSEKSSFSKFLKSHVCSRKCTLTNCVMLLE